MAKKKNVNSPVDLTSNIITYNGKTEDRTKCRLINGKYYKIGDVKIQNSGDCYLIDDLNPQTSTLTAFAVFLGNF